LYAAGEAACTGVHGANRLASNSLLEGLVFGARAADVMRDETTASANPVKTLDQQPSSTRDSSSLLRQLQQAMWQNAGLLRDAPGLRAARSELKQICAQLPAGIDRSSLELRNLHAISELIVHSALAREESRGAHYRNDFPLREDARFQKHSLLSKDEATVRFIAD
jgi:L-aspartate oxidase